MKAALFVFCAASVMAAAGVLVGALVYLIKSRGYGDDPIGKADAGGPKP